MKKRTFFNKKIWLALCLSLTILITAFPAVSVSAQERFSDVADRSKSYYIPVNWAVENDIAKGYKDGTFRPDNSCTRSQFVTFIWRMAGRPSAGSKNIFSDVDSSMSSYKAILWAVNEGIIVGYSDGTFRPNEPVLRRQVAVMLWRMSGRPSPGGSSIAFSDVKASDSFARAVIWGSNAGVIKGSDGKFYPADLCKRQQIVTFLYRYNRELVLSDPYRIETRTVQNKRGLTIVGDLYIPRRSKGKAVILCHGLSGNRKGMMDEYARVMAENGYICYAFDFCGGGAASESGGNTLDMSVLTEVDDLEAVYDMVRDLYLVKPDNIYLLGHSQGALVDGLFAAKYPEKIKGMIFLSNAFTIPDIVRDYFPDHSAIKDRFYLLGDTSMPLGRRFAEDVYYMDPYTECTGYNGSVLILHGSQDTGIPYKDGEKTKNTYSNSRFILYNKADHMLTGNGAREQSYKDILAFLS